MAKRDYYDILGIARGASADEIKRAYRNKAKALHPDLNPDCKVSETDFKEVNEAYECLKDPQRKAAYDRFGHAAFEGGGFGNGRAPQGDFGAAFADVFEDLFGEFVGARSGGRTRPSRGQDLRYDLRVTLEEAFRGIERTITVPGAVACGSCNGTGAEGAVEPTSCPTCSGMGKVRASQGFFTVERTCPTCSGNGQIVKNPCKSCAGAGRVAQDRSLSVVIPAGVESGTRIRLAGEGEAGVRGGPSGDLYIFVEVREHPIFIRDGRTLACQVPVGMATAALGGEVEVPTIDGGRSRVKVPAGSQTGRQMRLRGKGMPPLRHGAGLNGEPGDMVIELVVETPVNLTARQKELLREFEGIAADNHPQTDSFFSKIKGFWEGLGT
ncbi:molecular chaperone DnaJ [Paracoccus sp. MC1862]|uniref:molecular chaperone DnaJ n=1 Tax=Paracoccus sp. MC1862 TaxID=2760307 RepID=UPI001603AC56|nr:molecular chaperone DnaJ [Paracoccus sp. MC1862]MBB1498798.1 molecular chaperone DnaJ [Paracoccus sp. MC1862]QQO43796.1 molecular chaperone DnaJ [Paracoccus sp. MC1862]